MARAARKKEVVPDVFQRWLSAELHTQVVREHRFHPVRKWRFDYCLPEHKIAVEIDGGVWTGGRHTIGMGWIKDQEKLNTAAAMGWSVFHFTPEQKFTSQVINILQMAITNKARINGADDK